MKVYIKNVWDLVREDSEVTNENNEPVFTVRGNYFSFGKKNSFRLATRATSLKREATVSDSSMEKPNGF